MGNDHHKQYVSTYIRHMIRGDVIELAGAVNRQVIRSTFNSDLMWIVRTVGVTWPLWLQHSEASLLLLICVRPED